MAKLRGALYPRTTATNDTNAALTFNQRKRYDRLVFPDGYVKNMVNFWGEEKYYGRISPIGHPVTINESKLKQIEYAEENKTLYLIDFVADAWKDLARSVRSLTAAGAIKKDSPFSNPTASKAWSSPYDLYHEHMVTLVYPTMTDSLLAEMRYKRMVKDFSGFIKFTGFFADRLADAAPLTLSGFLESDWVNPHISGLCVSLGNNRHDLDFIKCEKYIYDESFKLFARTAYEHGFSIDKNAPWRLVADINSPVMREYMLGVNTEPDIEPNRADRDDCGDLIPPTDRAPVERYGASLIINDLTRHAPGYQEFGNKNLFPESVAPLANDGEKTNEVLFNSDSYFIPTTTRDMEILKLYLFDFYNSFVGENEVYSDYEEIPPSKASFGVKEVSNVVGTTEEPTEGDAIQTFRDPDCTTYLKTKLRSRKRVRRRVIDNDNGQYGYKWMIRSYFYLRLVERNKNLSKNKQVENLRHLYNIFYASGRDEAAYVETMRIFRSRVLGPLVLSEQQEQQEEDIFSPSSSGLFAQQKMSTY